MTDTTASPVFSALDALRRRWLLCALVGAAFCAIWFPFVSGLPDLYRANATILVAGQLSDALNQSSDEGTLELRLQAIKQQSLSRARVTELLDRFELYPEMRTTGSTDGAIARFQREISLATTSTAQRGNGATNTVAFKLSYLGREPQTVAAVTNAVASFYVAQNSSLRSESAEETVEFLKAALVDAKNRLEEQERRVSAFTSQNLGTSPQQFDASQTAVTRISLQLQSNNGEQVRQRERRQTLLNEIANIKSVPLPAKLNSESELVKLRLELAALRLTDTESSPNVKAKQRQIDALAREIEDAGSRSNSPDAGTARLDALQAALLDVDTQLQKLGREEETLQASLVAYQTRIERAPARGIEFDAIMQDYRAARDNFDSVQKRYDTAELSARVERRPGGDEFRVLDAAIPPLAPAGPNRLQLYVAGLFVAIVLGVGSALLRDRIDTSLHTVDDLRAFTHVPVLTSIPLMRSERRTQRGTLKAGAVAAATVMVLTGVGLGAFRYAQGNETIARMLLPRG